MLQLKPQKGKAFDKLPKKTLDTFNDTKYLLSIKYDGNQIFIVKRSKQIQFFTSDWKEFTIELVEDELSRVPGDFILVGEFMNKCEGKLGDRRHSAVLTTYRTNFSKSMANIGLEQAFTNIKVFDCLEIINGELQTTVPYGTRIRTAAYLIEGLRYLETVKTMLITGKEARACVKQFTSAGWEGGMLVEPDSIYHIGKRVNHSIKLKNRPTADLRCIGVEEGEGKYTGKIGALVLLDSFSREVSVGSGLSDEERGYHEDCFLDKIIEIEYEQIMDTYIQPTYVRVREDKKVSD